MLNKKSCWLTFFLTVQMIIKNMKLNLRGGFLVLGLTRTKFPVFRETVKITSIQGKMLKLLVFRENVKITSIQGNCQNFEDSGKLSKLLVFRETVKITSIQGKCQNY